MARSLAVIVSLAFVAAGCSGTGSLASSPSELFPLVGGDSLGLEDTLGPVGPATLAPVSDERGLGPPAVLSDGSILVVDNARSRVLRVTPAGLRTVVAGTGHEGFSGDGGPAVEAALRSPTAVVAYRGGFLISDEYNGRVRWVGPDGVINTVAGNGQDIGRGPGGGPTGDGGPALRARISRAEALAVLPDGGFLVADCCWTLRRVAPDGIITRMAGDGNHGDSGDGGPATAARVEISSLSVAPDGGVLIGAGTRVRRIAPDGIITTVAGSHPGRGSGDGGPASAARFESVSGVLALADGGFLVADGLAHAVRRVSAEGVVSTLYGSSVFRDFAGRSFYSGDEDVGVPIGIAAGPDGLLLTSTEGVLLARDPASERVAGRIVGSRISGARISLTIDTATDAAVAVEVRDVKRRLAHSVERRVAAGRRDVGLSARLKPGVYTTRVIVNGASGTATDQMTLSIGSSLDRSLVEDMLYEWLRSDVEYIGPCARMGRLRIDCAVLASHRRCVYAIAVTRHNDGQLWQRRYQCAKRRAKPFRATPMYVTAPALLSFSRYY
jgi:hypothetical protein